MKLVIDIPGSMQAMCYWHKSGIRKLTGIELDMLCDAVTHGTDAVEMLKDFKTEEDCISRQAVLDGVDRYIYKSQSTGTQDDFYSFAELVVKELPAVTPKEKTAAWVPTDEEPHEDYECNKCGYVVSTFTANIEPHTEYKYCPNCGARMVIK